MPTTTAPECGDHALDRRARRSLPRSAGGRPWRCWRSCVSAAYLIWRWGFTLDGSALWLGAAAVLAETYGFVMLVLLAFSCWRTSARVSPAAARPAARVAVLIATFDEDEDVLRPTVVGALGIRNDVDARGLGARRRRPRLGAARCATSWAPATSAAPRRARHAKAGNINHALGYVDAEFLVTLDADHVPRPELLERMLGYMADPKVAVVQGPQAFYNRGFGHPRAHDDPLRNEQSIFFDVICPREGPPRRRLLVRLPVGAPPRAALDDVGGVATDTVVEDAHTSMLLNARGWRVVYHDEVMALGLAPEEIGAFVVQRGRWARGSLQMLRLDAPDVPPRPDAGAQRLEYSASCLHFLEGAAAPASASWCPPIVLATGAVPIAASPLPLPGASSSPQFVLVPLTSWALTRGRYRPIEGERYAVVRMEGYLRALGGAAAAAGARASR